jgi:hypothetical protein
VVEDFTAATAKIAADPSAFSDRQMSEVLGPSSGGGALEATVGSFSTMREKGYRVLGALVMVSVIPTEAVDNHNERGVEVSVSVCQDQTSLQAVDSDGNPVTEERYQYPEFLLRQYSVRRPQDESTFRVYGFETINGKCP